jgi:hypothetical protein
MALCGNPVCRRKLGSSVVDLNGLVLCGLACLQQMVRQAEKFAEAADPHRERTKEKLPWWERM